MRKNEEKVVWRRKNVLYNLANVTQTPRQKHPELCVV